MGKPNVSIQEAPGQHCLTLVAVALAESLEQVTNVDVLQLFGFVCFLICVEGVRRHHFYIPRKCCLGCVSERTEPII